jgi:hypothetical protein
MPNKWLPTRRSFSAEPGRLLLIGAHYGPSGFRVASSWSWYSLLPHQLEFGLEIPAEHQELVQAFAGRYGLNDQQLS